MENPDSNALPLISIIIIVRNESRNIARCLRQIIDQDYPKERLEILLADGESIDDTVQIAQAFDLRGARLEVLTGFGLGRSQGLNKAIRAAHGDIIARLDARTVIERDYLRRCLETMQAVGAMNVGGVQKPIAETTMQKAIGLALQHMFGVGDAQFRLGKKSGPVDSVYLGFFQRKVFDEVGLFDEEAPVISEDSDMNQRIRDAGGIVWLNHEIHAYCYPREGLSDLWRLYFRYGGAHAGNFLKARRLPLRRAVPPVFVGSLALGLLLSPLDARIFASWIGLVSTYVAADVIFSARIAVKGAKQERVGIWVLFPRLVGIFPTMHFARAFGFFRRITQRVKPGTYWGY